MTDASLQKIAATYGTPTFVFDTDALQARVRAIQAIWGREIDLNEYLSWKYRKNVGRNSLEWETT